MVALNRTCIPVLLTSGTSARSILVRNWLFLNILLLASLISSPTPCSLMLGCNPLPPPNSMHTSGVLNDVEKGERVGLIACGCRAGHHPSQHDLWTQDNLTLKLHSVIRNIISFFFFPS